MVVLQAVYLGDNPRRFAGLFIRDLFFDQAYKSFPHIYRRDQQFEVLPLQGPAG